MSMNQKQFGMKWFVAIVSLVLCAVTASGQTFPSGARQGFGAGGGAPRGGRARGPAYDAFYHLGPDSLPQNGVPHGKLIGPTTLPTSVYIGPVPAATRQNGATSLVALSAHADPPMTYAHTFWVYVPAQYDPSQPAALIVFNDCLLYTSRCV